MKNKEAETYSQTILIKKEAGYKRNKEKKEAGHKRNKEKKDER